MKNDKENIDETLAVEECRPFERRWWSRTIDSVNGSWIVQVRINGQLKLSKSFEVGN